MEPQSSSFEGFTKSSSPSDGYEPDASYGLQAPPSFKRLRAVSRIVIPRLAGSALIVMVSLNSPALNRPLLLFSLAGYLALVLLLTATLPVEYLRLKQTRLLRAAVDILCITLVTHATGGLESPWFLAYAFPIILASKHLKQQLIYVLVLFALVSFIVFDPGFRSGIPSHEQAFALVVNSLLLLGLVILVAKLNKPEQNREARLLEAIEQILTLSAHSNLRDALQALIARAVEFTGSSHGLLRANYPSEDQLIVEAGDLAAAIQVRISERISFDDRVIGEITLSSHRRFHYYSRDREVLRRLAALGAIAFRNTDLLRQIQVATEERKKRLRTLHETADQLTAAQDFQSFLDQAVNLTLQRLESEEAALFLASKKNNGTIEKVAVSAAAPNFASQLTAIETTYKSGESLTGQVYATGKKLSRRDIPQTTAFAEEYARSLPSNHVKHYIGVPLKIGEETLGALRVLNKKSTRYCPRERCFVLSKHPFSEEDEELMETIASQVAIVLKYIQLLKRAKESERYLKNIIESSPDPIIVVDDSGLIKVFNQASEQLFGYSEEDAIGQRVANFYATEEHAREIGRAMWQAENHRIQNKETRVAGPDRKPIPVSISASWLVDEMGRTQMGSVGIFKDQREINKLRDEMLQNEKLSAIGRLAHTVGHELKHDLGAALFYVEPLLREARRAYEPEIQEVYENMRGILWGATTKLQNLLMVGQPREPQKRYLPAADLFREVEMAFSKQAADRQIELQIRHPSEEHGLKIDVEQFHQVFWNLFTNSTHAIQKRRETDSNFTGARIELKLCRPDSAILEISWADNGCGIESEKLPHVFEAFYTDNTTGSGLGLFLAREILSNHGGAISIESMEGEETRVTLRLPVAGLNTGIEVRP